MIYFVYLQTVYWNEKNEILFLDGLIAFYCCILRICLTGYMFFLWSGKIVCLLFFFFLYDSRNYFFMQIRFEL